MLRKSKEIRNALAVCCMASLGALCAGDAKALNVTVSGTTYDIKFTQLSTTNSASTVLADTKHSTAAPWWGDATKASDFRAAYKTAAAGTYDFNTGSATEYLGFVYNTPNFIG